MGMMRRSEIPRSNARMTRRGFSLVELLVVIGIIAILVGILLPTLRRAREAAQKTACLSNLHQLGVYLQQYQNTFNGKLPIFTIGNPAYLSYFVYSNYYGDYSGLGLMCAAGIAPKNNSQEGRVFYCPTAQTIYTANDFNYVDPANPGASNPWFAQPGSAYSTRFTYSLRPEYWAYDTAARIAFPFRRWDMNKTTATTSVYLISSPTANPRPCFPTPRDFTNGTSSAIIMDLNSSQVNRAVGHRGAVNALYANWAAKTVPDEYIKKWLDQIQAQEAININGGAARRAHFSMWLELDHF